MSKRPAYTEFLNSITSASELYAIFGRGFPHSFYKAYVRATPKGKWWRVKHDIRTVSYDPHKDMQTYPREGRLGAITGPVGYFLLYENIGLNGLVMLQSIHDPDGGIVNAWVHRGAECSAPTLTEALGGLLEKVTTK